MSSTALVGKTVTIDPADLLGSRADQPGEEKQQSFGITAGGQMLQSQDDHLASMGTAILNPSTGQSPFAIASQVVNQLATLPLSNPSTISTSTDSLSHLVSTSRDATVEEPTSTVLVNQSDAAQLLRYMTAGTAAGAPQMMIPPSRVPHLTLGHGREDRSLEEQEVSVHWTEGALNQLINEVRARPYLWQRGEGYTDHVKKDQAWKMIARLIGNPKINALACKKRWRNLRDRYAKIIRRLSRPELEFPGQQVQRPVLWFWFKSLQFLEDSDTMKRHRVPPGLALSGSPQMDLDLSPNPLFSTSLLDGPSSSSSNAAQASMDIFQISPESSGGNPASSAAVDRAWPEPTVTSSTMISSAHLDSVQNDANSNRFLKRQYSSGVTLHGGEGDMGGPTSALSLDTKGFSSGAGNILTQSEGGGASGGMDRFMPQKQSSLIVSSGAETTTSYAPGIRFPTNNQRPPQSYSAQEEQDQLPTSSEHSRNFSSPAASYRKFPSSPLKSSSSLQNSSRSLLGGNRRLPHSSFHHRPQQQLNSTAGFRRGQQFVTGGLQSPKSVPRNDQEFVNRRLPGSRGIASRRHQYTGAMGRNLGGRNSVVKNLSNPTFKQPHGAGRSSTNSDADSGCTSCGFSMTALEQMFGNWFGLLLNRFEDHDKNLTKLLDLVNNSNKSETDSREAAGWVMREAEDYQQEMHQATMPAEEGSDWMLNNDYVSSESNSNQKQFASHGIGNDIAKQYEEHPANQQSYLGCELDVGYHGLDSTTIGQRGAEFLAQLNQQASAQSDISDNLAAIGGEASNSGISYDQIGLGQRDSLVIKQEITDTPPTGDQAGFGDFSMANHVGEDADYDGPKAATDSLLTDARTEAPGVPSLGEKTLEPAAMEDQPCHSDQSGPLFPLPSVSDMSSIAAVSAVAEDERGLVSLEQPNDDAMGSKIHDLVASPPQPEPISVKTEVRPEPDWESKPNQGDYGRQQEGSVTTTMSSPSAKRRKHSGSSPEAGSPTDMDLDRFLTEKVKCQVCTATLPSRAYAAQHLRAHFAGQDPLCGRCGNVFGSPDELTKHLMEVHGL